VNLLYTLQRYALQLKNRLPAAPGHPERLDYKYERKASVSAFMFTEPKWG